MTKKTFPAARPSLTIIALAVSFMASQGHAQTASGGLEEVIVTAQKRSQAASKTPLSLSAVTGDDLKTAGVVGAKGLTDMMAGVEIGSGFGGSTEISIRGLGNRDSSERGDPAAAFHIDGIYLGRPQGAGAAFYDLERVEVLRGPQGTLYGRNATAGAVNVITKKPKDKFEAAVDVTVGNYNLKQVEAMLNVPVNDVLSLRGVISSTKRDGYADTAHAPQNTFSSDRDNANTTAGRLHALMKFSKDTTLLLSADATTDKNAGSASYLVRAPYDQGISTRFVSPKVEGKRDNSSGGFAAEFKTQTGVGELTYLYGHRTASRNEQDSSGDVADSNQFADASNKVKQDSHELRLASTGVSPLQWVTGLYLFKETNENIDFKVNNLTGFPGSYIQFKQNPAISQSKAIFGQATYSLTPELRLTGGLRYTTDDKSRVGTSTLHPSPAFIVTSNDASGSWSKATWKLGADYDLNKSTLLYANVATGYKAGGYNDGTVASNLAAGTNLYYNPENITSYEVGMKGRFLDNKLQLSTSMFIYDYKDLQVSNVVNNFLTTQNAAKARMYGAEVEGKYAITKNGKINFSLGLLNAQYKELVLPNGTVGGVIQTQSFVGKQMDKAPDMTLSLGYTHNWTLDSGASITAYAGHRYSTSYVFTDPGTATSPAKQITQPSYGKTDVNLTYNAPGDKWYVQAWAKNLENKIAIAGVFSNAGANSAYLIEPRTFGVRAGVKF